MGNYQDAVRRTKKLRNPSPDPEQVCTFGNPFKLKRMHIDEAEEDMETPPVSGGGANPPEKRAKIRRSGSGNFNLESGTPQFSPTNQSNQASTQPQAQPQVQPQGLSMQPMERQQSSRLNAFAPQDNAQLEHIKSQCFKLIRQPGKVYNKLRTLLETVQDSGRRSKMVRQLITECKRFRKNDLISELEALIAGT